MAKSIEDAVEEPLQLALAQWRRERCRQILKKASEDVVEEVVGAFLTAFVTPVPLSVWEPVVAHTITRFGGTGVDEGYLNPFLSLERVRNEVFDQAPDRSQRRRL